MKNAVMDLRRTACRAGAPQPLISARAIFGLRSFTTTPLLRDDRPPLPPSQSSGIAKFLRINRERNPPARNNIADLDMAPPPPEVSEVIPKMGPTAGRSVLVMTDLAQAFMKLRMVVGRNNVKQDFFAQRFHERPGLKRKRLKALRHRRRFKEGFKRMIKIVLDMKKKGM